MRVLQDLVLLSLLLLSISKVYSQEDKKTKELFNSGGYISDGYALDSKPPIKYPLSLYL